MLSEERLVFLGARAIDPWISPAIEQVTPLPGASASVPGSLRGGGAVIDDPDFTEFVDADQDLVEGMGL